MREIYFNVSEAGCQDSPVLIGYQGENEVTRVNVDYSKWVEEFGPGSLTLEVMRSGDTAPYLATLTKEGDSTYWLVSNVDTGAKGTGAAGFVYTVGNQIKRSAVFRFFVGPDVGGTPGERPDPYERLIAYIESLLARTEQSAAAAAESAQDAADEADKAETARRAVEDLGVTAHEDPNGPSVEKTVDPETGAVTLDFGLRSGGVSAVNGQTGAVTLDLDDIPDGAQYARTTPAQVQQIGTNKSDISSIEVLIPNQASAANQLADKAFVNSSIQTSSAHFRGNWENWAAVPTNPELYPADDDGVHTPTSNDYMVIQDASDYPVQVGETALEGTWRFKYSGIWATNGRNGWHKEYQVNETPLAAAQLAALNSGATAELIAKISTNENDIEQLRTGKQAKITASGILKGDGAGGVSSAAAGADYLAPSALEPYRTAAAQDTIDSEQDERIEDLEQTTTATTIGPSAIATFNASAANMPLKGLTVNIEPVQAEGTPSPENPLPISGWTGVNVFDDPKHALKINWNQIRTDSAQTRTLDGITTKYDPQTHLCTITNNSRTTNYGTGSTQCVISSVAPIPGHRYALLGEYHAGVAVVAVNGSALRTIANVGRILAMSAITPNTGFRLRITSSYDFVSAHPVGDVYSFYLNIVDITQLLGEEAAATATYDQIAEMFPNDWYPYNAGEITCVSAVNGDPYQKIAVNWEDEAGTVYGGTLDVVNRKLNSYPYYSSYNGETIIGPWISSMDVYAPGATPTLGAQVVDMGGAATSYDLPNVPEITTLLGTNNIFADCGNVIVTYGAYLETVKAYADQVGDSILSAIAPLETSYTASRAYTVGSFLFVGTKFYKVTAAIAEGGTITPDTNVTQTTVAEQLMALANA